MLGGLFENFVLGQILRAEGNKGKRANLFFYRDQQGHELDFIKPVGEKFHLYECKWSANPKTNLKIFSEMESLVGKKNILSRNIFSTATESYVTENSRIISLNDEKWLS